MTPFDEPFARLLPQGIVRALTYVNKRTGAYLAKSDVIENGMCMMRIEVNYLGTNLTDRNTMDKVEKVFEKMSKSKCNGIDPKVVVVYVSSSQHKLMNIAECARYIWHGYDSTDACHRIITSTAD